MCIGKYVPLHSVSMGPVASLREATSCMVHGAPLALIEKQSSELVMVIKPCVHTKAGEVTVTPKVFLVNKCIAELLFTLNGVFLSF